MPDASSLERTDQAARKIEDILSKIPGVKYTTSVVGFSLLSLVQNTYSAFFFVTFKPWSERTRPEEKYTAIKANINKQLAGLTEGLPLLFRRRRFLAWALPADSNSFWKIAPAKTSLFLLKI